MRLTSSQYPSQSCSYSRWFTNTYKERLEFYHSLGATVIGYHWLINPKAELVFKNLKFELFTSCPKGLHYLKLWLHLKPCGYLKLRRMEFLDKVLLPKTYKNLPLSMKKKAGFMSFLKLLSLKNSQKSSFLRQV